MSSLLDIHKYSKKAFQHLYEKLSNKDFKRSYITKDDPITAVTGILWDITQGDKELKKIIETMDNIDKIKAENSRSRLEKITVTWLKKAYREHFENGYVISRSMYLKFIKIIMKPTSKEGENKLIASGTKLYNKIYSAYKMRQMSVRKTDKLDELKAKYPNLNIETAYRYAIVTGKFNLNADDIEDFEYLVQFLTQNQK
ncbi:hypothetical protein CIG1485E_a0080 (plasmid) [Campylobacter iguaniorum]|uniref:Uncharacterized protein n=1 Tax=Campylobacter iguaniorum TaxID=1244531 RepID=A0A076FBK1_9BACT|nr:hypothetical protein [Campylobacter iguaniorum]AII15605.1 hypothetical protein CIG1485E_a0080 [Campylobacter iguaniorum]